MDNLRKIRVLIADDHPIVRTGITYLINCQPDFVVVAEASNGKEAVKLFNEHQPDIAILDLQMPQLNGIEATQAILRHFPRARIIILSGYEGEEYVYKALNAGAIAYLVKGMEKREIIETIRCAYHHDFSTIHHKNKLALTNRELEMVVLMVQGKSNRQIALHAGIAESTVKAHITSIFMKLGVQDRTAAVSAVIQRGIVHLADL